MNKSKTYIAVPPGYTIKEQLEDRGLTQKEFALRMEMSEKHISKLVNGEVLLTTDMAIRLEMVLGLSAQFWLNLENIYREKLAKVENENSMEEDVNLSSNFPYNQMAKLKWVSNSSSKFEKVVNLRKFFEINRLGLLLTNPKLNVLYRRIGETSKSDFALMAWAQKAKIEARNRQTAPININGIVNSISEIRKMTLEKPEIFCEKLVKILEDNGVALIFLPHIGGSFLHGATFYDGDKIVVGMTVRGKDADKFWFSLFHELGHIVLGHINGDYYNGMEEEANLFAQNHLIPSKEYSVFISEANFSESSIIRFAKQINIDCGIVVGRLQKEGRLHYNMLNNLKTKYIISNE